MLSLVTPPAQDLTGLNIIDGFQGKYSKEVNLKVEVMKSAN
jgi:hypothetical protein